jgi:anti-sigma B factor antagonist
MIPGGSRGRGRDPRFDPGGSLEPPRFFDQYTYSDGDWCVLELSGEIDAAAAASVREGLDRALAPSAPPRLVVDLSRARFLDSSGFRPIAQAGARARARGGLLRLVCPAGSLRDYLRIMNAAIALPLLYDLHSALAPLTS